VSLVATLVSDGRITDPETAKGRLLAAAAHLFRERGYDRTTVRDLARAIGIQSGSLFHHYDTKEDILAAVMTETIVIGTIRLKAATENIDDPSKRILALIKCELESILGERGEAMAVLVHEWRSISDERRAPLLALRAEYESIWLDGLKKAREAGLLTMDEFILRRFLTGSLAWIVNWYNPDGDISVDELATYALALVIK